MSEEIEFKPLSAGEARAVVRRAAREPEPEECACGVRGYNLGLRLCEVCGGGVCDGCAGKHEHGRAS